MKCAEKNQLHTLISTHQSIVYRRKRVFQTYAYVLFPLNTSCVSNARIRIISSEILFFIDRNVCVLTYSCVSNSRLRLLFPEIVFLFVVMCVF